MSRYWCTGALRGEIFFIEHDFQFIRFWMHESNEIDRNLDIKPKIDNKNIFCLKANTKRQLTPNLIPMNRKRRLSAPWWWWWCVAVVAGICVMRSSGWRGPLSGNTAPSQATRGWSWSRQGHWHRHHLHLPAPAPPRRFLLPLPSPGPGQTADDITRHGAGAEQGSAELCRVCL